MNRFGSSLALILAFLFFSGGMNFSFAKKGSRKKKKKKPVEISRLVNEQCFFEGKIDSEKAESHQCEVIFLNNEHYLKARVKREDYEFILELTGIEEPNRQRFELTLLSDHEDIVRRYKSLLEVEPEKSRPGSKEVYEIDVEKTSLYSRAKKWEISIEGTFGWQQIEDFTEQNFKGHEVCYACNCPGT